MANQDMPISQPISITLKVGEWLWLLGYMSSYGGENDILDKLYGQVMERVN